jgi:hypothetical protein
MNAAQKSGERLHDVAGGAGRGSGLTLSMWGWYVLALWNGCTGAQYLQNRMGRRGARAHAAATHFSTLPFMSKRSRCRGRGVR